jgi:hypothetical protein
MSLPITIPYTFATQSGSIPLAQLDTDITTLANAINGIGNGTNALATANITGGTITGLSAPIPVASGGTNSASLTVGAVIIGNGTNTVSSVSPGSAGNVLASDGTNWNSVPNPANAGSIPSAFSGLKITTPTSANVAVTANYIALYSGSGFYTAPSVNITIQTGVSGAGGLDTGTIANSTWYSVWVIYNGTTVSGLLSLSATSPTMPSGYTYKARVGWVRYGSSALVASIQYANRAMWVAQSSGYPVISNTAQTQWTAVSMANFAPSTASAFLISGYNPNTVGAASYGVNGNSNISSFNYAALSFNVNGTYLSDPTMQATIQNENGNIYIYSNGGNYIFSQGWTDNL